MRTGGGPPSGWNTLTALAACLISFELPCLPGAATAWAQAPASQHVFAVDDPPGSAGKTLAESSHMSMGLSLESGRPAAQPSQVPAKRIAFPLASEADASLATPEVLAWLEELIRRNLPESYEDDRKWNQQKEVWDGIDWRREGWKLETKRRKKLVNAGTWTRYSISFVEPDKNLFIEFHQLETLGDGRIAFGISVDCALDVFGRLSRWVRDVQVVSISANADAACRLTLEGTVQFQVNPLVLPPDISMRPTVERAHIELTHYRVRRVSQVGGDFAKVLGEGLKRVVDEKLEDLNSKLADKINAQLEKHSEKLSFSAQSWLRSKLITPGQSSGP
ncbi:MAG: hypothetical protein NXI32_03005 [bacterium]|nr:hypothetical protein [bacterium]